MQKIVQKADIPHITQEDILVVKRNDLFAYHAPFNGLNAEVLDDMLNIITKKREFLPRSIMETDPNFKQVIPYLIFNYQDRYFLMQRRSQASEQRLKDKLTLGIGGHIRYEDMQTDSIFDWARREFHEEVSYEGDITFTTIGILNDDSNDVGKVHIGLVLLLKGEHPNISIKSELKSGNMLTLDEMKADVDRMESWSQAVYHFLCSHTH